MVVWFTRIPRQPIHGRPHVCFVVLVGIARFGAVGKGKGALLGAVGEPHPVVRAFLHRGSGGDHLCWAARAPKDGAVVCAGVYRAVEVQARPKRPKAAVPRTGPLRAERRLRSLRTGQESRLAAEALSRVHANEALRCARVRVGAQPELAAVVEAGVERVGGSEGRHEKRFGDHAPVAAERGRGRHGVGALHLAALADGGVGVFVLGGVVRDDGRARELRQPVGRRHELVRSLQSRLQTRLHRHVLFGEAERGARGLRVTHAAAAVVGGHAHGPVLIVAGLAVHAGRAVGVGPHVQLHQRGVL
mmetsp:Transcript_24659/g.50610  ORF Transcript_24659/g.50610 Transcript_24659/m.50610 type:complete len:303 (-) Transcript_24659:175-1083(-)